MMETFTKTFNPAAFNESGANETATFQNLEADDAEIFYKSIAPDLDSMHRSPKPETLENIFNYSQNLR